MADLSSFPVTHRWPPEDSDVIQYYGWPTPNGLKVSIMLEEIGLPYDAHPVPISEDLQFTPEFISLNPNSKIPAIIDPDGPDGAPMALFESGAILIYLADKTGKLLPAKGAARYEVLQWLMFQMGGIGPMFGQMGFFVAFHGKEVKDPIPRDRYVDETERLLEVLDEVLDGKEWICGEFSIADIAICPWLRVLETAYHARDLVGWDDLSNVPAYFDRFMAREAVQRGLKRPSKG